jgi:hypothetical protein
VSRPSVPVASALTGQALPPGLAQGKVVSLLGKTAGSARFCGIGDSRAETQVPPSPRHAGNVALGSKAETKMLFSGLVRGVGELVSEAEAEYKLPCRPALAFGLVGSRRGSSHVGPSGSEACQPPLPNPSVKGTSTSGLRPLAAAPYLER